MRALCNGVVETMGRVMYDGKVKHPVTAHPKVDPDTGACQDTFAFTSQHVYILHCTSAHTSSSASAYQTVYICTLS